MQPTPQDVHVDQALTDFSVAYIQDDNNFIASKVFPSKPVKNATNKFFIFDKNDWNRDDAVVKRAPGEEAPRSGFSLSTDSYSAEAWWTEVPMSDMVVRNADPSVPVDRVATSLVTQRMLIRRERLYVASFFNTGIWATDRTGAADGYWDDYSSDPEKQIDDRQADILEQTGRMANTLVVGFRVHKAIKRHPIIRDKYKYTSSESITEEMIANALELEKYVVAKASYATNAEGGATKTYSFIHGKHAWLGYTDGSPSIMEPCAGAIFTWTELTGASDVGVAIDQYYDVKARDDVVRGQFAFDMKMTGADLGCFFSGIVQ